MIRIAPLLIAGKLVNVHVRAIDTDPHMRAPVCGYASFVFVPPDGVKIYPSVRIGTYRPPGPPGGRCPHGMWHTFLCGIHTHTVWTVRKGFNPATTIMNSSPDIVIYSPQCHVKVL